MAKNIFILGRQPELGVAELESLLNKENVSLFNQSTAITHTDIEDSTLKRIGGSQKVGIVLSESGFLSWPEIEDYIKSELVEQIIENGEGKINFGVSCYGVKIKASQLNGSNIALKKLLKSYNRPVRIVPNNNPDLSTAQVLHNKLIGVHGFELLIIQNSKSTLFAKTIFIQDINGYSNRDQNRPKRDAKIGMLPPKLAQIMINLANPSQDGVLVDPFCGTGVILQEGLLMGFEVIGTDINERMVDYSKENLTWLNEKYNNLPDWEVNYGDATEFKWNKNISTIVCETFLGKPLFKLPPLQELKKHSLEVDKLIKSFLLNLAPQLKPDTKICIAIPAWITDDGFITLQMLDHLEEIGYNLMRFKSVDSNDLFYHRPDQIVARQLLVLIRK